MPAPVVSGPLRTPRARPAARCVRPAAIRRSPPVPIEPRHVAVLLFDQLSKRGHALGISSNRSQVRVVELQREIAVVAVVAVERVRRIAPWRLRSRRAAPRIPRPSRRASRRRSPSTNRPSTAPRDAASAGRRTRACGRPPAGTRGPRRPRRAARPGLVTEPALHALLLDRDGERLVERRVAATYTTWWASSWKIRRATSPSGKPMNVDRTGSVVYPSVEYAGMPPT